jgi:hypothetical protein
MYQHLPLQYPPKCTQIWIFSLKTNHQATLVAEIARKLFLTPLLLLQLLLPKKANATKVFVRFFIQEPILRSRVATPRVA